MEAGKDYQGLIERWKMNKRIEDGYILREGTVTDILQKEFDKRWKREIENENRSELLKMGKC